MIDDPATTVSIQIPVDWEHLKAELKPAAANVCLIDPDEKKSLQKLFSIVTLSLLCMIVVSLAGTALLTSKRQIKPLLGIVAGFLGSSTAALRSALDRYAKGIEDSKGNQWPDPKTRKERFNRGMAVWFLYRPVLGAVVGFLIYLSGQAEIFKQAQSIGGLAFCALVGGLFAKSLLDLLLGKFKQLFDLK